MVQTNPLGYWCFELGNTTCLGITTTSYWLTHDSKIQACYTFDAGPNACIFLPAANVGLVAGLVRQFFPPKLDDDANNFFRGAEIEIETPDQVLFIKTLTIPNIYEYFSLTLYGILTLLDLAF